MRLTDKGTRKCAIRKIGFEKEYEQNQKECDIYNKLADLEDVEDQLGIDLITLFKVFQQHHIVHKEKTDIKTKNNVSHWRIFNLEYKYRLFTYKC